MQNSSDRSKAWSCGSYCISYSPYSIHGVRPRVFECAGAARGHTSGGMTRRRRKVFGLSFLQLYVTALLRRVYGCLRYCTAVRHGFYRKTPPEPC